jgi:hypothetical protein
VCGAHDFGVLPLGGPVVAGDQAHAVQAMKVAEHEGIAGFVSSGAPSVSREVPGRVLRPAMSLEERVLFGSAWLDVSPRLRTRYLWASLATALLFTEYVAINSVCPRLEPGQSSRGRHRGHRPRVGGAASKFPLATAAWM